MSSSLARFGNWMMGRGKKQAVQEKRYYARIPAHERVVLLWKSEEGESHEDPAQVLNSSDGGFAIRLRTEVPVGCDVRVRSGEDVRSAVVRHVHSDDGDYVLGLEAV